MEATRFTYTDADLEKGAHALLEAHEVVYDRVPDYERESMLANAIGDVETVLDAIGGVRT